MSNREEYEKIEKFLDGHNKIKVRVNEFYDDVVNIDITIQDALAGFGNDRIVAEVEGFEATFDQDDFAVRLDKDSISRKPEFFFEATEAFLKSEGEEFRDEFGEVTGYSVASMEKVVDTIQEQVKEGVRFELAERFKQSEAFDSAFDKISVEVMESRFDSVQNGEGDEASTTYVFTPVVALAGKEHETWIDIQNAYAGVEQRLIFDESGDGVGLENDKEFVNAVEKALIGQDVRFRALNKEDMDICVNSFIEEKVYPKVEEALDKESQRHTHTKKDEYGLEHKYVDLSREPKESKKKKSTSLGFN
ncbi:hypothetical protein [Salinicola aestuarinus]|uniref:hypothetical protein n=1 Tax=Salinicola aestuarinus TaxID=1949082 RepID=UPI000DA1F344|nr:hypothetical protein [Salinicola aestuarinus]